jgi:hypothetical protein
MAPVGEGRERGRGIGGVGTIVFGIWLAFSVGGYDIWDGWMSSPATRACLGSVATGVA